MLPSNPQQSQQPPYLERTLMTYARQARQTNGRLSPARPLPPLPPVQTPLINSTNQQQAKSLASIIRFSQTLEQLNSAQLTADLYTPNSLYAGGQSSEYHQIGAQVQQQQQHNFNTLGTSKQLQEQLTSIDQPAYSIYQNHLHSQHQQHQQLNHNHLYHYPYFQSSTSASITAISAQSPIGSHQRPPLACFNCWWRLSSVKQRLGRLLKAHTFQLKFSALLIILAILLYLSASSLISIQSSVASSTSSLQTSRSAPGLSASNQRANFIEQQTFARAKLDEPQQQQQATNAQDVLKSKLLIGEFVITSQNYSESPVARESLAQTIVKLMDQVFLSTEVRRVYSRMEITNIRKFTRGIVVDCNIILSDSIAYAAQQFGIALYDSLSRTNERLAGQPTFLLDKSSIRFNTVPDKDLAIVPTDWIPPAFVRPAEGAPSGVVVSRPQAATDELSLEPTQPLDQNAVVWSEWSQWSSCVDKNGVCDAGRLHSRLRKCVAQHTGEKVDAIQCKQRFNMQDQELEVTDCSASCATSGGGGGGGALQEPPTRMISDDPGEILPQTAPSIMMAGSGEVIESPFSQLTKSKQAKQAHVMIDSMALASSSSSSSTGSRDTMTNDYSSTGSATSPASVASSSTLGVNSSPDAGAVTPSLVSVEQQMSCSNCTSDEICLLLMSQKVPFCAKVKDRQDESGCGGWCKAQSQLCQPVGQNAFKCIHDSECLADEWRCHDSACIPLAKRCDGHSNCYDSSDERDCPAPAPPTQRR